MTAKFDYDDIVYVRTEAPAIFRPGSRAWIVGVTQDEERRGSHYDAFEIGNVYTIEFEDGSSVDVHEDNIQRFAN